ncbi:MAG: hypothetical protein TREMPRED_002445 [Tremellales sp. Tagirdzhanova-0007]|nr:MAG: hypothetical protein TREMPRED_002445 [Tremellales sp. Tagirdzhanova-0007]
MSALRFLPRQHLRFSPTSSIRYFRTTRPNLASAGYGDPQDEKADNHTPTASSTPDPQPGGQGKGPGSQTGTTDPEIAKGSTGSAGGEKGAGSDAGNVSASEIRETKKIGEDPKKEGASEVGPIGG